MSDLRLEIFIGKENKIHTQNSGVNDWTSYRNNLKQFQATINDILTEIINENEAKGKIT